MGSQAGALGQQGRHIAPGLANLVHQTMHFGKGLQVVVQVDVQQAARDVAVKLVEVVGQVTALRTTTSELTAEELAECNTAAKK